MLTGEDVRVSTRVRVRVRLTLTLVVEPLLIEDVFVCCTRFS
jgi:hypothetical protein